MYAYISESDLLRLPGYSKDMPEKAPEEFKKILWACGLNVKSPELEIQTLLHRNLQNKVVSCRRWVSIERTDKQWLRGGHASLEAVIASSPFMRSELKQMSRTLNSFENLEKDAE